MAMVDWWATRALGGALAAFPVNDDFVGVHPKSWGQHFLKAAGAPQEIEHLFADFADEEVVVILPGRFVMRREFCDINSLHLTGFHQSLQSAINGR